MTVTSASATTPLPVGWAVGLGRGIEWIVQTACDAGITLLQLSYLDTMDNDEGVARIQSQLRQGGQELVAITFGFAGEDWSDVPSIFRTCGLAPRATRSQRMEHLGRIAAFARRLGVQRLAGHVGHLPEDGEESSALAGDVAQLCDALASHGQILSMETGQEPAAHMVRLIQQVDRPNLKVNFDPANFVLYAQGDPRGAWRALRPWVDAIHCKDAQPPVDPHHLGTERRIDEGDVGFEAWLGEVLEGEFSGPIVIETGVKGDQLPIDLLRARQLIQDIARKHQKRTYQEREDV